MNAEEAHTACGWKDVTLILVGSEYQINLGYIARAAKNFGISEIRLVNPKCNHLGKQAIRFSKHARELLESAKIYQSLNDAIEGSDFVIGTTAIWHKAEEAKSNIYSLDSFKKNFKSLGNASIIIGRDGTGLTKEELGLCDASIYIPGNKEYQTLNISHAVSIILYELTKGKFDDNLLSTKYANTKDITSVSYLFKEFLKNNHHIRNKPKVASVFMHIIKRSYPTKEEVNTLKSAFTKRKSKK
ncbi:SpoU family RNA 2'-O ribose methyltransferase [Candidatus Mancarchaeum acidiphilum]|uniref:SpoU family RNA 2'-O ribose methyltransferase n=1 Tax=Candidatus Mancarchaeum acidiphilum TaxID=1920749 RepID=A0A218NLS6_9ARCH|nr:TrmJ/YjtD family RNA methyltransferase [Candidatus Mancarchaeum acidiphilum]ASI13430.1 SpoU family RNA 2'-O ribose methyltransferase [Candidatus Mancarchaeum acidiphilum]